MKPQASAFKEKAMWLESVLNHLKTASALGQNRRPGPSGRRRCPAVRPPTVKRLEDRYLLTAGGVTPSLVKLGDATPLPIQLPLSLAGSPFGGPDIYQNFQGPADGQPGFFGNEPNQITNFIGVYAGARVQGTGTDNNGNALLWDADLRLMQGVYQGRDGGLHVSTFVEV
jgi:hypothetical protein